jgi:hypothetical protein
VSWLRTLSGAARMRNADTPVRLASGAALDKSVRVTHVHVTAGKLNRPN